ncbi:MAG: hypothetical protein QM786_12665 [Breznakibacter sp.]
MTTLKTIGTIARYEAKTLTRGWFFRIFAAISIVFIAFFDLVGLATLGDGGWSGRVIPGSVPYLNLFLLNLFQAVIAVFLSSDFLGRDKKLDTTEAFYVRSMSNYAYVLGKMLGIMRVFLVLNLIVLAIGAVFNLIARDVNFIPVTYWVYPLVISLPTLVLILGMSFFLMALIRNQAIVFILMLGLLGASLFFLSGKLFNVFDFVAFSTPMVYSGFVGWPNWGDLILLRGGYTLLGLAFVCLTILKLPRLPQEKLFRSKMLTGAALTGITALVMLTSYVTTQQSGVGLRAKIRVAESQLPVDVSVIVGETHLEVEHKGDQIQVKALLKGICKADGHIQLVLNPGFKVESAEVDGSKIDFSQTLHLVDLKSSRFSREGNISVAIAYSGKPNNEATFAEIPENARVELNRLDPLVAGKQLSFVEPGFLLLTREACWYPVAASRDFRNQPQFTRFELKAKMAYGLSVLSQGSKEDMSDGWVAFKPSTPLNALSLLAGRYDVKTVKVDGVEVSLWMNPQSKSILSNFDLVADTIPDVLSDMKREYERKLGMDYPFGQFCLVEVPIHFYTYPRSWTLATDDNMPGMVFYAEHGGAGSFMNDISRQKRRVERDNDRNNEGLLPKEIQVRLFRNVVGNMLFEPGMNFRFGGTDLRSLAGWGKQAVFPQFLSYTNSISQEGFPIMQFITENYMFTRVQSQSRSGGFGPNSGNSDQILLKMRGMSLTQMLNTMKNDAQLPDIISKKGDQFFATVEMRIKPKEIDRELDAVLAQNRFSLISSDKFVDDLSASSGNDMKDAIRNWMDNASMPAFIFGKTQAYKVTEGDRIRYFVRTQVANAGNGDGVINIGIRAQMRDRGRGGGFGGGFGPGGGGPAASVEQSFSIAQGQKVEIGLMSDSEPRELIINTYVAENIPSSQRLGIDEVSSQTVVPFEGMREYTGSISIGEKFETIVDNEDEGFSTENQKESKTIKDWWMKRNEEVTSGDKYQNITFWSPSLKWQPTLNSNYFGRYVKSSVYKAKGNGNASAQWKASLTESGNYTVYVYLSQQRGGGPRRDQNEEKGTYLYSVSSDDGNTEVEIDPSQESGWVYLGDFYISQGEASVSLSDKTERNIVLADAVKWVKKSY